MSTPNNVAVVHLLFALTTAGFFMVGTFGSQFNVTLFTTTIRTYLYMQTGGGVTMYFAGHENALFGCSTPVIIADIALASGVVGAALSLVAAALSMGLLTSPSSTALKKTLTVTRLLIHVASMFFVCFVIAFYTADFCGYTFAYSDNWTVDYGFIFAMILLGELLCWPLVEFIAVRSSRNTGLGGEGMPLNNY